MFCFLFLAPYSRTTRYEEATFRWKTKEKKTRLARAPHDDIIGECQILLARFPIVTYRTCIHVIVCTIEAGRRKGILDTRRRGWFPWRIFVARVYKGRCQRCPVSINLYATEGNKEPFFFHPPKLGDPPHTRELIDPLYHPLLLRASSLQVRSCAL